MTVQQERPALDVVLPQQRRPADDVVPPARQPGAWVTREDQLNVRWMGIMMLALGLYAALFVWLGARVFG